MKPINVFELQSELVRTIIRDTIETYSGQWRLVHEAIQNAHDAVQKNSLIQRGKIEVQFFFGSNTIRVQDNGTGISVTKFGNIFLLGAGDKKEIDLRKLLKGSQGVGIKSTLFTSKTFKVETVFENNFWEYETKDFYRYHEPDFPSEIMPPNSQATDRPCGSAFTYSLKDYSVQEFFSDIITEYLEETSREGDDIGTVEDLKAIIETYFRTKTYIGCVQAMLGSNPNLKPIDVVVTLHFDSPSLENHEKIKVEHCGFLSDPNYHKQQIQFTFPGKYLDVAEKHGSLEKGQRVDRFLSDFEAVLSNPPDSSIKKLLVQKFNKGDVGKLLSRPKRDRQTDTLSFESDQKLLRKHKTVLDRINGMYLVIGQRTYLAKYFHIGARQHISANGLPTNITLNLPHGALSYLNNVYVVLDVDYTLGFGKRNLPGRAKGSIDAFFSDVWNILRRVAPIIVGQREGRDPTDLQKWNKEEELDNYKNADNNFRVLPLSLKTVPREEQEVVALFFELVGRRLLKGYFPFRAGGNRTTYDALFYIDRNEGDRIPSGLRPHDLKTVEFKFRLSELIGDFSDNLKYLQDIDLLVCWENDYEEDSSEYYVHNLEREGIDPLPGAKFRIQRGTDSCQVLVLKDFIESLNLGQPNKSE